MEREQRNKIPKNQPQGAGGSNCTKCSSELPGSEGSRRVALHSDWRKKASEPVFQERTLISRLLSKAGSHRFSLFFSIHRKGNSDLQVMLVRGSESRKWIVALRWKKVDQRLLP